MPILHLRIQLDNVSRPPVWREILISSGAGLLEAHAAIQGAMGWEMAHLFYFLNDEVEYSLHTGDADDFGENLLEFTIGDLIREPKDKIEYCYDYGDIWMHIITCVAVLPDNANTVLPKLLDGKGACPPEDVGGPMLFEEFKVAMANPGTPDFQDCYDWLGMHFDPKGFDLIEMQEHLEWAMSEGIQAVKLELADTIKSISEGEGPGFLNETTNGPRCFINISNHPSDQWSQEQLEAAREYAEEIVDFPFPHVPATANEDEVAEIAEQLLYEVGALKKNIAAIHVMGEHTLTYLLVGLYRLTEATVLAATTDRVARIVDGKKVSEFNFVRFREYQE